MSLNRNPSFCLKLQLGSEIRKVGKIPASMKELQDMLVTLYAKDSFLVTYQDDEGDVISVTNDSELKDVMERSKGKLSLKLCLRETEQVSVVDKLESLRQSLLKSVSGDEFGRLERSEKEDSKVFENLERLSDQNSLLLEYDPVLIEEEKKLPEIPKPLPKVAKKEKKPKEKPAKAKAPKPKKEAKKPAPKKPEVPKDDSPIVHQHITCDGCNEGPIIGIRYKCTTCYDFDLCENCESKLNHAHAMIKMRTPMRLPAEGSWQNSSNFNIGGLMNMPIFNQAKTVILENLKKEMKKKLKAKVKSQKYPDEILALKGSEVKIFWKVKNSGKNAWPEGTTIVLDEGEFEYETLVIGEVKPGECADIAITALVPNKEGMFKGTWRIMVNKKVFGHLQAKVRTTSDKNIQILVGNMGFSIESAKKALFDANGDVNLAISQILRG